MILAHIRTTFADAFFPRLSEWIAAFVLTALGWMLLVNDDLMASTTARGYALMLAIASQHTWAVMMILFGLSRLTVLAINGAWRRSPLARGFAAFLACFFWTQITLSFAPTFGFAFIMACGFLGMDLINTFRSMRDARTVADTFALKEAGRNGARSI